MKINEIWGTMPIKGKAGLLPYYAFDGVPKFLFMEPSDPLYGGAGPGIAKGEVDEGEGFQDAAIREAVEELGLKTSNLARSLMLVWRGKFEGAIESYMFAVYMVEIKDPEDFNPPHYETKQTMWLTPEEFSSVRNDGQATIVQLAAKRFIMPRSSAPS